MADLLGTKKFLEALSKELGVTLPLTDEALVAVTAAASKAGMALESLTDVADHADELLDGLEGTPEQVKEVLKAALRTIFRVSNTVQNADALITEARSLLADTRAKGVTNTTTFPQR